jgi:hypothetical protein
MREKHQVSNQRRKYVRNNVKKRNLPRGNRPLFLRNGHANLLPFLLLGCVGLRLHASLPADTSASGRRSLVQRGGVDNGMKKPYPWQLQPGCSGVACPNDPGLQDL